jgi:hypothetical protein
MLQIPIFHIRELAFSTSESTIGETAHIVKHRIRLAFILFHCQPGVGILLVTKAGFMVSFIRLECAPFKYIGILQVSIVSNNDKYFRLISKFSQLIMLV